MQYAHYHDIGDKFIRFNAAFFFSLSSALLKLLLLLHLHGHSSRHVCHVLKEPEDSLVVVIILFIFGHQDDNFITAMLRHMEEIRRS